MILLPESTVTPIVDGFTPESSSVTVQVMLGLLFVISALAVGYVIARTGATLSLTRNCRELPRVEWLASAVEVLFASSVALTVTS